MKKRGRKKMGKRRAIRRKVSRKMPAALKRYWARKKVKKSRRSKTAVALFNEGRSMKGTSTMKHKRKGARKFSRRFKRSAASVGSGIKGELMTAAYGVGAIALNKVVKNQVAKLAKVDAGKTALVGIFTAYGLKMLLEKVLKQPALARGMNVAISYEVFDAVRGYMPANVKTLLAGSEETMTPTIPETPVMGFLPDFPLQGADIPEAIIALEN